MVLTRTAIFAAFLIAFLIALAVTPLSIRLAEKIGAVDVPRDGRRMHENPIPRFGGMAIFLGTMVSLCVILHGHSQIMTLLIGGTLVYALGVVDDLKDLSPKVKFLFETLIAILMYTMGVRIEFIMTLHIHLSAVLCFLITVLWIVGITNTINLIDGLDGLAAGVAVIASLSIAYIAYIHGNIFGLFPVCAAMMALAGGALGFLPYNYHPAKTFMGDSGSLFLGFMLATLAAIGPLRKATLVAIIVPVLVLGLPIMDTLFAILRRKINRRPIMEADRGHIHHRLMASGYGQRRVVLMIYGISAIMGMAAVLFSRELFKDGVFLILIALVYTYVFLSDADESMREEGAERSKETSNDAASQRQRIKR